MDKKSRAPNKANRRAKYDWDAITIQFLTSDHADFRAFVIDMGLPINLCNNRQAGALAQKKRSVISAQTERIREALLTEPIRAREQRKFEVLKELEESGRALRAVIMNNLLPELHLTQKRKDEPMDAWVARLRSESVTKHRLTAGEIMALGVAAKHADELIRKAAGLEDFDWEHAEKNAQAVAKAGKMEFEIVKTSNALPLDQLPHAPEDREKKETG